MALSGKAGSCLPLVGSLQHRTLFGSFPDFPNFQGVNLSVDHFLTSNWPVDYFSSSVCLLSLLWLFWFTLAQSFALGRVFQFVAMPLGLATSLSGFTSSVKEVREVGFEVGHLSAHVTITWLIRANICQRLICNSLRVDYLLGVFLAESI